MNGLQFDPGVPIIPVVTLRDAEAAVPLARALAEGGLDLIEITFRTPAAAEAVRRIKAELPEMRVGGGTLVTAQQIRDALSLRVDFGVAPGLNPLSIQAFADAGVPFMPGVATPSEIEQALSLGCRLVKFFPARQLGGVATLAALAAPYASLGVRFCPTGGIGPDQFAEYLGLKSVACVGGSWLTPEDDIASGRFESISDRVRESLVTARDSIARRTG